MRFWPVLLIPVLTLASAAQNSRPGTGTVTGHVYCADTNAPARSANIQLEPIRQSEKQSGAHRLNADGGPAGGFVQTALDGSFVISNVAPGSYYVVVIAAGYLSPRAKEDDVDNAEPQPAAGQPPLVIPRVDVQADQTANIDIRLERGAAVSGTVRFDDGSPAAGVMVTVLHKEKGKWVQGQGFGGGFFMSSPPITDDIGHYRIGGLRDREYLMQVLLVHTEMTPPVPHGDGMSAILRSAITVFSGDTMRQSEAVPFRLSAGEERTGEDITIPLSKLHSVSGVVIAASDGHAINGGDVEIVAPEDDDAIAQGGIDKSGSFRLEGVPEGDYKVRVRNGRDTRSEAMRAPKGYSEEKVMHEYGELDQPIKIEGDVPNLVLSVPEKKTQTAASTSSQ